MVFLILVFEIHLPTSRSLKDKRRVVRSLVERLVRKHRLSIIESDHHDLRQRAQLAVAAVRGGQSEVDQLLDAVRAAVEMLPDAMLTSWQPELVEPSP